jgi:hypothetical protein
MLAMMANVGSIVGGKNHLLKNFNKLTTSKINLFMLWDLQMLAMLARKLQYSSWVNILIAKKGPFHLMLKINKVSSQQCQQKIQTPLLHWKLTNYITTISAYKYANTGLQAPTKEGLCQYFQ